LSRPRTGRTPEVQRVADRRDQLLAANPRMTADAALDQAANEAMDAYREVATWHVITADPKRLDCVPGCDGPDPHLHEFRAPNINPNRAGS
jgi:hypothetical protein